MFEAWNEAKGRKVQGGRILSQGTVYITFVLFDYFIQLYILNLFYLITLFNSVEYITFALFDYFISF
jgi:hypothetical protein